MSSKLSSLALKRTVIGILPDFGALALTFVDELLVVPANAKNETFHHVKVPLKSYTYLFVEVLSNPFFFFFAKFALSVDRKLKMEFRNLLTVVWVEDLGTRKNSKIFVVK